MTKCSVMKQKFTSAFLFLLILSIPSFAQSIVNTVEAGTALYYADYLDGRRTASGEVFSQAEMTCSHKTHPFGTWLRVSRMDNQKSVTVRVNDRGPFCEGCVVDLSKAAAIQIDLLKSGKAEVKVEVLGYTQPSLNQPIASNQLTARGGNVVPSQVPQSFSTINRNIPNAYDQTASTTSTATGTTGGLSSWEQELLAKSSAQMRPRTYSYSSPNTLTARSPANTSAVNARTSSWTPTEAIKGTSSNVPADIPTSFETITPKGASTGYGVQVASYTNYDNADKRQRTVYSQGVTNVFITTGRSRNGDQVYRVMVGPFNDQQTATISLSQLKRTYQLDGFVVDLKK